MDADCGAVGVIAGLFVAFVGIFAFYLVRAPFLQRDEERKEKERVTEEMQRRIDERQAEVDELKQSRAKLAVIPRSSPGGGFYLEVTNRGEQAELEAQITIVEGSEIIHGMVRPPNPYAGYWEGAACDKAFIKDGHMDRLVLGMVEYARGFALAEFKMVFFDKVGNKGASFGTTSWITLGPNAAPPGEAFRLRITISATPRMPDGPFERDYVVRRGEREALIECQGDVETSP